MKNSFLKFFWGHWNLTLMHWAFCYLDGFIYWSCGGAVDNKMCKSWIWVQERDWTWAPDNSRPWSKFEAEKCTDLLSSRIHSAQPGVGARWHTEKSGSGTSCFPAVSQVLSRKTVRALRVNIFQPQLWVELQLYILDFLQHPTFFFKPQMISSYQGHYHSMFYYLLFSQSIFRLPQGSLRFFSSFENPFL